ncbi:MAG: hypothetical protein ABGW77_06060 [Campylobacterales bacterium]
MESFGKRAPLYHRYSLVQNWAREGLSRWVRGRVLDLGAGSAGLCRVVGVQFYLGVDSSPEMARLNRCPVVVANFDQFPILEVVKRYQITQIVSFSALHWSKNLEGLFQRIGQSGREYLLLLFTGESFQELHRRLGITSPLPREREILEWAEKGLPNLHSASLSYTLHFPSPRELFRYLRGSGVSGGVRVPIPKLWALRRDSPLPLQSRLLLLSSNPAPVHWFRQFAPGIESFWRGR